MRGTSERFMYGHALCRFICIYTNVTGQFCVMVISARIPWGLASLQQFVLSSDVQGASSMMRSAFAQGMMLMLMILIMLPIMLMMMVVVDPAPTPNC